MKVKDMPYEHLTIEEIREELQAVLAEIQNAKCHNCVLRARERMLKLLLRYSSNASLCYIRYSCNTADEYYVKEHEYFDEIGPEVSALLTEISNALLASPYRAELEKVLGPVYFRYREVESKAMSPEIVEDMIEENKLCSEYSKLMAGLEFQFRGETYSRAALAGFFKDDDRETRKEAYEVFGKKMLEVAPQLDDIYDRMVKVRDRMAKKLGYKNFVELGYYRMNRVSYGQKEVETFRKNVLESWVPANSRLRLENAKDLGLDKFMFYDDGVIIPGGDPRPTGGKEEIFQAAREMYHEMSDESAAFIDLMLDNDAFDVDARKNKWGGGYCSEIAQYKQPFILANFNGTAGDVDVMTHEAGHAFNAFLIADNKFALEIGCGGMETAETHSMSMEYFAWKYIHKFFGEDAKKYKYMHALENFSFIPYGTMVDAFQHIVYENPEMTPAQRNEAWLELERKFRPHIQLEGIPFIEEGRRWQYQMHIYESPFYYIDYCLAQTAAFGFLLASQEDYDGAYARYIRLMKQGGETYYEELLKEAEIPSPFQEGALQTLAEKVEALLRKVKADI
ncbi:MAG: M3 family oligoendopeptidase [Clostridia bacterium]|jgi:M3 family oligoendopeptidase|nr:M3 family oligoendopeptidase [Clostridia bacterium]